MNWDQTGGFRKSALEVSELEGIPGATVPKYAECPFCLYCMYVCMRNDAQDALIRAAAKGHAEGVHSATSSPSVWVFVLTN